VSGIGQNGGLGSADLFQSVEFPIGSDVFNLPPGVTANAPDSFIFNNRYIPATAVPGPVVGAGLPGLSWLAVVFSPGGDGGRKAPEHPAASIL
jgi:hypothetical protein